MHRWALGSTRAARFSSGNLHVSQVEGDAAIMQRGPPNGVGEVHPGKTTPGRSFGCVLRYASVRGTRYRVYGL